MRTQGASPFPGFLRLSQDSRHTSAVISSGGVRLSWGRTEMDCGQVELTAHSQASWCQCISHNICRGNNLEGYSCHPMKIADRGKGWPCQNSWFKKQTTTANLLIILYFTSSVISVHLCLCLATTILEQDETANIAALCEYDRRHLLIWKGFPWHIY